MGSASTLVLPGVVARRVPRRYAARARWWRPLFLVMVLGGGGLGGVVRSCGPHQWRCDSNDTAPIGMRFRVEVLEELPNSDSCLALEPGTVFFLTAGETGEYGTNCRTTVGAGAPEGLETGYDYTRCEPLDNLGAQCDVAYRELCPDVAQPGYIRFELQSRGESLLGEGPSEGEFYVGDYVPPECATRASCDDRYRIRISRVMEE